MDKGTNKSSGSNGQNGSSTSNTTKTEKPQEKPKESSTRLKSFIYLDLTNPKYNKWNEVFDLGFD